MHPEAALQIQIADVLRLHEKARHFIWFSVPNELMGAARSRAGHARMARFKRMGLRPGVSDFIIARNGLAYFLELKIKGNGQSENQKQFEADALRAGAEYKVVYSLDEAIDWLQYWGIIP